MALLGEAPGAHQDHVLPQFEPDRPAGDDSRHSRRRLIGGVVGGAAALGLATVAALGLTNRDSTDVETSAPRDTESGAQVDTLNSVLDLESLQPNEADPNHVADTVIGQVNNYLADGNDESLAGFTLNGRADAERLRGSGVTQVTLSDNAVYEWFSYTDERDQDYLRLQSGTLIFEGPQGNFVVGPETGDLTAIQMHTDVVAEESEEIVGGFSGLAHIPRGENADTTTTTENTVDTEASDPGMQPDEPAPPEVLEAGASAGPGTEITDYEGDVWRKLPDDLGGGWVDTGMDAPETTEAPESSQPLDTNGQPLPPLAPGEIYVDPNGFIYEGGPDGMPIERGQGA